MSAIDDPGYWSDKENEPESSKSRALQTKHRRLVSSRNFPRGILRNFSARASSSRSKRVYGAEFKEKPRRRESSPQKVSSPILLDVSDGESTVKHIATQRPSLQSAMSYWLEQHQHQAAKQNIESSDSECLEITDYKHIHLGSDTPASLDGTVNLGDVRMRSDGSSNDPDTEEFSTPALSDCPYSDAHMVSPSPSHHGPITEHMSDGFKETADEVISTTPSVNPFEQRSGSVTRICDTADHLFRGQEHEMSDYFAYRLDTDPERRSSAIGAICDQVNLIVGPQSVFATNSHHALAASHILLAASVYTSGTGLIGFIGSPTPETGLWDKLESSVDGTDGLASVLGRLINSGSLAPVADFAEDEEDSDCPARQCVQWQFEDVDARFKEQGAMPAVVPTHPMIRCLFA